MSITSILFIFVFLPCALIVYYIVPDKIKDFILLGLSLMFYALGSFLYVAMFACSIVITVIIGRLINAAKSASLRKMLLAAGVLINSGLLIYYKYTDFAIVTWGNITSTEVQTKNILLPLGISFFTFKAISYLADSYTGKAVLAKNPIHDALYLSFFAQIQSGPLTRYSDMNVSEGRVFNARMISHGVYRFLIGFSKKVLIANILSIITAEIFGAPVESMSTGYAWLGSICYSLQIFFDFAGYSDMAIGLSEMFGYKCMENFNYPYMTENVTRFWRRWHISLSEWFRDYVYIPLGGSRNANKWKVYINLLAVWALTGIWHGAAWKFVAWGLGYFVVIAFEKLINIPGRLKNSLAKIIYRIATLLFINFQWVVFNAQDLSHGLRFIRVMVFGAKNELADLRAAFLIRDYAAFLIVAIILCFPVVPKIEDRLKNNKVMYIIFETVAVVITALAFIWAVSYVVAGQNNPFAYANF